MKTIQTDCLIIGSGISASVYALAVAEKGLNCIILSEENNIEKTNSNLAQGGVIYEENPNISSLVKDVKIAGANLSNEKIVEEITVNGYKVIKNLFIDKLHTDFDKTNSNKLLFTQEGAHSKKRIIFAKDSTGKAMLASIHDKIKNHKNIKILKNHMAVDLLTLSHSSKNPLDRYNPSTCFGAYVLNNKTGEIFAIKSKKTILATGGMGQVFRYTSNTENTFGHGIAMAYRIGGRVMNLEYQQFHPTVFIKGETMFLISEAVRGEGGILKNNKGEAFMKKYHPLKDLAPRDIVSRAIHDEMLKTSHNCVYIDLSSLSPSFIQKRFPRIYQTCLKEGIDITKQPIPVVPAAHYCCGGIYTDISGRTNIKNLNAVGETGCTGYHGANRLASTSLLEAVSVADLCAKADIKDIKSAGKSEKFRIDAMPREWVAPKIEPDLNLIKQDIDTIKNTMWNYVGIVRSKKRLSRAEKILRHLKNEVDLFYKDYKITKELLNLRNGVQCALLVLYAALQNTKSKGCHYRED